MTNAIAYVTNTGNVKVVDLELNLLKSIHQPDMQLSWPTFSQNNERILFSGTRVVPGHNQKDVSALYELNLQDGPIPHLIYTNQVGTGMISADTPHYALWSPDSSKIALITQTIEGGMTLFILERDTSNLIQKIDGAPIYFSWSCDSNFLFAHVSDSYYLVNVISGDINKLGWNSSLCMCPMWSPKENSCLIGIDSENNKQNIGMVNIEGDFSSVLDVEGSATFMWSSSGKHLALSENLDNERGYYNNTYVIDTKSFSKEILTFDPLLCMFWSPKGDQICYVTLSDKGYGSLRFAVSDLEGNITYLPDFKPSQMQLIAYMFFDQYSISHSPWSADGTRIIFSGLLGYEEDRTPLPTNEEVSIFQVELTNPSHVQKIDRGVFGTWTR